MRGVRANGTVIEVTDEPARSGEGTVLRVAEAGICGSDLHMIESGSARRVMGHEFGGWADGRLGGRSAGRGPSHRCMQHL